MNETQALAAAILRNIGPDPHAPQHLATLRQAIGQHCAIQGCDNDHRSSGFCVNHLRQHRYVLRNEAHAKPVLTVKEAARLKEERIAEVERLLKEGESPASIVERLDTTANALSVALYRAGRRDLARPFAALTRKTTNNNRKAA